MSIKNNKNKLALYGTISLYLSPSQFKKALSLNDIKKIDLKENIN